MALKPVKKTKHCAAQMSTEVSVHTHKHRGFSITSHHSTCGDYIKNNEGKCKLNSKRL